MQEDLITKLSSFGFTVNQAKVYLCIAQAGKTSVGRIAKNTSLHRQDIYKLIPKLERMGLITKTIDKPFMIEAIPVERALQGYIEIERKKAEEKVGQLENNLKDLVSAIQTQPQTKEEARFTLLTTDEAIKNKGKSIFEKDRKEFLLVATMEQISYPSLRFFHEFLQIIADNNAKIKLLLVSKDKETEIQEALKKVAPDKGEFAVKCVDKSSCRNYQIIDSNEVWIGTQQKTQTGYPSILWTNDQNIVEAYKEIFKKAWNNPKAKTFYDNPAKAMPS